MLPHTLTNPSGVRPCRAPYPEGASVKQDWRLRCRQCLRSLLSAYQCKLTYMKWPPWFQFRGARRTPASYWSCSTGAHSPQPSCYSLCGQASTGQQAPGSALSLELGCCRGTGLGGSSQGRKSSCPDRNEQRPRSRPQVLLQASTHNPRLCGDFSPHSVPLQAGGALGSPPSPAAHSPARPLAPPRALQQPAPPAVTHTTARRRSLPTSAPRGAAPRMRTTLRPPSATWAGRLSAPAPVTWGRPRGAYRKWAVSRPEAVRTSVAFQDVDRDRVLRVSVWWRRGARAEGLERASERCQGGRWPLGSPHCCGWGAGQGGAWPCCEPGCTPQCDPADHAVPEGEQPAPGPRHAPGRDDRLPQHRGQHWELRGRHQQRALGHGAAGHTVAEAARQDPYRPLRAGGQHEQRATFSRPFLLYTCSLLEPFIGSSELNGTHRHCWVQPLAPHRTSQRLNCIWALWGCSFSSSSLWLCLLPWGACSMLTNLWWRTFY